MASRAASPAWVQRLSPPPSRGSARTTWEDWKLSFRDASCSCSVPVSPHLTSKNVPLNGATQLRLAVNDFPTSLRAGPTTRAPAFFPALGIHDPRSPLGFARTHAPGSFKGTVVGSKVYEARPRRYVEHAQKLQLCFPSSARPWTTSGMSKRASSRTGSPRALAPPTPKASSARRPFSSPSPPIGPRPARSGSRRAGSSDVNDAATTVDGMPSPSPRRLSPLAAQRAARQLASADANCDGGLNPSELGAFLRAQLARDSPEAAELELAMSRGALHEWFALLDVDGKGSLTRAQLFGFTLKEVALAAGHRLVTLLLRSYPELISPGGRISFAQIASVVHQLGYDTRTASELMAQMDADRSGSLSFAELDGWAKLQQRRTEGQKALDGSKPLERLAGLLEKGRTRQARMRLKERKRRRVAFHQLSIDRPELVVTQKQLGAVLTTEADRAEADRLGRALRHAMAEQLKRSMLAGGAPAGAPRTDAPTAEAGEGQQGQEVGSRAPARGAAVLHVCPAVADATQLASETDAEQRLIELLQHWDLNDSGTIKLREFHQALVLLGIDGSASAVQLLFDSIDDDGSYAVTYDELAGFLLQPDAHSPSAAAKE